MSEHRDELNTKGKLHRLLWIDLAVMVILLVTISIMSMQAIARSTMEHPQDTHGIVAVITNSGSTNSPGSTLTINKDGSGSLTFQKRARAELFKRFEDKTFAARTFESNQLESILTQIGDVGTIPNHGCIKSVSFGSTTTITYKGKTSGDLSCLSNEDPKIFQNLASLVQSMYAHI